MLRCAAFCAYVARPLTPQLPFLYEAKMVGVTLKTGASLHTSVLVVNKEKVNAYQRKWRKANPDKVKAAQKRYWEKKAAEAAEGGEA